ncbi:MAG: hypothetical protein U0Q12_09535 [Vicinamibacterales bacterium]
MHARDAIKRLYFGATPATIERDLAKAVALLKTLPDEDERERVAVFMDGLSQMRSEWAARAGTATPRGRRGPKAPKPPAR